MCKVHLDHFPLFLIISPLDVPLVYLGLSVLGRASGVPETIDYMSLSFLHTSMYVLNSPCYLFPIHC